MPHYSQAEQQAIALAGLMLACKQVDSIAQTGRSDHVPTTMLFESVLNTAPDSAIDVYGDLSDLKEGLELVARFLGKGGTSRSHVLRYALNIMHLQRQLDSRGDLLNEISKRLDAVKLQVEHFGVNHENVINNLASIYQDTISTMALRIQVAGHAEHLKVDLNAAKIRALLLAAVRSSMLWRQLGGHRWQFLLGKGKILKASQALLAQC